jgi:uncharacterized Zn-finger protein
MGFPPRLNGKVMPLPSNGQEICPKCGREFRVYDLIVTEETAIRECPHCDHKFKVQLKPILKSSKKTKSKQGRNRP